MMRWLDQFEWGDEFSYLRNQDLSDPSTMEEVKRALEREGYQLVLDGKLLPTDEVMDTGGFGWMQTTNPNRQRGGAARIARRRIPGWSPPATAARPPPTQKHLGPTNMRERELMEQAFREGYERSITDHKIALTAAAQTAPNARAIEHGGESAMTEAKKSPFAIAADMVGDAVSDAIPATASKLAIRAGTGFVAKKAMEMGHPGIAMALMSPAGQATMNVVLPFLLVGGAGYIKNEDLQARMLALGAPALKGGIQTATEITAEKLVVPMIETMMLAATTGKMPDGIPDFNPEPATEPAPKAGEGNGDG